MSLAQALAPAAPVNGAAPAAPRFAIDEATRRKPDFDASGNWVTLGDGQDWCLPRPKIRLVRARSEIGFGARSNFDATFDGIYLRIAMKRGDEFIAAALEAGEYLLLRNYDLTPEEMQELIYWDVADKDGGPAIQAVLNHAQGFDTPKPSTAG